MGQRILAIADSDGNRINLLEEVGLSVVEWRPRRPAIGATFREAPNSDGREPSLWRFEQATETLEYNAKAQSADDLIEMFQDLYRLLIKGLNYHTVNWQGARVWLECKAEFETNTRYALISLFQPGDDDFPFRDPFVPIGGLSPSSTETGLILERSHWLGLPPGTGECVEISSTQEWPYDSEWATVATAAAGVFYSILELSTGRILAGSQDRVYRSDDDGDTWANVSGLTSLDNCYALIELDDGTVLAGGSGDTVYISTDQGGTFPSTSSPAIGDIYAFTQLTNGTVFVTGFAGVAKSIDSGASWSATTAFTGYGAVSGAAAIGNILFISDQRQILRSNDSGTSWSVELLLSGGGGSSLCVANRRNEDGSRAILGSTERGDIIAAMNRQSGIDTIDFWVKQDPSLLGSKPWELRSQYSPGGTPGFFFNKARCYGDVIYYGYNINVVTYYLIRSDNLAHAASGWTEELSSLTGSSYLDTLISAGNSTFTNEGSALIRKSGLTIELGNSEDCDGETYIGNKAKSANISTVKVLDASGATYTDIFPITSFPQALLPATPAVGDIIYFGSNTALDNSGPFDSLVFDLVPITLTESYTIVWEYWSGATWTTLTVTDNTNLGGVFSVTGVASVHWEPPSNWAATAIDSITAFWVRARLSALAGSITPPYQQNRQIYSLVNNWLEVDELEVGGDIPALARFRLLNESDKDGGTTSPELYSNRVICGLRSTSRGENFVSFIGISDEQNPSGIITTASGITAFNAAPSGRCQSVSVSSGSFATVATITFERTIVTDFYGSFHLYLRAFQTAGASGDIVVRARVTSGSGGITFTTRPSIFRQATDDFELLDLGAITIPVGFGTIGAGEIGNQAQIIIQAKAGTTRTVRFYGIDLIPTDEWLGDFTDQTNSADSVIGRQDSLQHLIDIDSISNPKKVGRSIVRENDANLSVSSIYEYAANGPVILQANATQRLYCLSAAYGTSSAWIAKPGVAWSVQAYKNQRYLAGRGSR